MTPRFIDTDEENETFILRDGERLTIPLMMRDSSPNPRLSPVQRAIAAATHDAVTFDAASHRPGYRHPATNDAAAHAATISARNAYEIYQREISDAWKSKSPPSGSYPEGNGCDAGDACTVNGSSGTLQAIAGHDGWLRCVAADDNADHSNDSRSIQHDAQSAQAIKDAAYSAYDLETQNSWRNK